MLGLIIKLYHQCGGDTKCGIYNIMVVNTLIYLYNMFGKLMACGAIIVNTLY